MSAAPKMKTPPSFLDAEFRRVDQTWFWQAFMGHIRRELTIATKLAFGNASAPADALRVAVATAAAYQSILDLPELIRSGKVSLPGQEIVLEKKTQPHDPETGDEASDGATE